MGLRFLVVDDSELNIKITATILARLGVESDSATNALDAYSLIEDVKYDLIMMDYLMPGINGLSATKHIRSMTGGKHGDEYYANVPILGLTGEEDKQMLNELLVAGVNDILFKPINVDSIKVAIARWCGQKLETEAIAAAPVRIHSITGIEPAVLEEMSSLDAEGLNDMLLTFAEDVVFKNLRINSALESEDYELYTVEVHRVKGEAGMIGAYEVAEFAKELETIGKATTGVISNGQSQSDNIVAIKQKTPELLAKLNAMATDIEKLSKSNINIVEMTTIPKDDNNMSFSQKEIGKIRRYVSHAIEALDEEDYKLTREWLEEISKLLDPEK